MHIPVSFSEGMFTVSVCMLSSPVVVRPGLLYPAAPQSHTT